MLTLRFLRQWSPMTNLFQPLKPTKRSAKNSSEIIRNPLKYLPRWFSLEIMSALPEFWNNLELRQRPNEVLALEGLLCIYCVYVCVYIYYIICVFSGSKGDRYSIFLYYIYSCSGLVRLRMTPNNWPPKCYAFTSPQTKNWRSRISLFFWVPWEFWVAMDQYLYIPFLGGWTSIYQLFWCSPGG